MGDKHWMHEQCETNWEKKEEEIKCTLLRTMLHEHWVILIIVPSFSCPFSTRSLYISGRSSSFLWMSSEIKIQNWRDGELNEITWSIADICTSRQRLTAPCTNSEIESSVTIVSIIWWLFFLVKWNREWKYKKIWNVT